MTTTVLLVTEGTYPLVIGGVSTWCDHLLRGLPGVAFHLLALGSGQPLDHFPVPDSLRAVAVTDPTSGLDQLGDNPAAAERAGALPPTAGSGRIMAALVRGLLAWAPKAPARDAVVRALGWCQRRPGAVEAGVRSAQWRAAFDAALDQILEGEAEAGLCSPRYGLDQREAAYRALGGVAIAAALPVPAVDLIHVTAAGWAAIPALAARAARGTPVLLTEHGVYVREAYLAAADLPDPAERHWRTRLAKGLAQTAYRVADQIVTVAPGNTDWELALGAEPDRLKVVPNGVPLPEPLPPARQERVAMVCRVDPLKDIETALRVARLVIGRRPAAEFVVYGPIDADSDYGARCLALRNRLGLNDRFRFAGPVTRIDLALATARVVLSTSVSEGLPFALLEALAAARPVVATAVGGIPAALGEACLLAAPGADDALADAVVGLLADPLQAATYGQRGRLLVADRFTLAAMLDAYSALYQRLAASVAA